MSNNTIKILKIHVVLSIKLIPFILGGGTHNSEPWEFLMLYNALFLIVKISKEVRFAEPQRPCSAFSDYPTVLIR